MSSGLFKMMPTNDSFTNHVFGLYLDYQDLAVNNLKGVICFKIKRPISHLSMFPYLSICLYLSASSVSLFLYIYIYYIYIYIYIYHHHLAPSARISLTLSRHPSLSSIASGWSSGLHPVFTQSCCV